MELAIKVQAAMAVDIADVHDLQNENFKTLTEENYVRLRNNLSENGFEDALSIWIDAEGKKWFIDGHQRKRTLLRMREDGWIIPPLPANIVEAPDRKTAKEILLRKEFPYGTLTSSGLTDFITEDGLVFEDIEPYLPEDSLDFIERNENPTKKTDQIILIQCPQCKAQFPKP